MALPDLTLTVTCLSIDASVLQVREDVVAAACLSGGPERRFVRLHLTNARDDFRAIDETLRRLSIRSGNSISNAVSSASSNWIAAKGVSPAS